MLSDLYRWSRWFVLSACALYLAAGALNAQEGTASIAGTVLDVAGKGIPGAAVSVRNDSNGSLKMVATDQEGKFSVSALGEGTYSVEASAPSFTTSRRAGLKLAAGASQNVSLTLNVGELAQSITVEGTVSVAAETSPSQNTLEARSAKSEISPEFIQNFASPVADYTELLQMSPGTFSVNPNGVGLGDSKTYFRGFADGQYTMTVDGIPFNDTNTRPTTPGRFFPASSSPESISTAAPARQRLSARTTSADPSTCCRAVCPTPRTSAPRFRTARSTPGCWPSTSIPASLAGGQEIEPDINLHQMLSDGYQTYNYQKRVAGFIKYQYRLTDRTTFTVFSGLVDLWTNTPNTKGPTRAQVAQFGDDYLMSGDPNQTELLRLQLLSRADRFRIHRRALELGHGWKFDNKAYTYRYWNKQNYNGSTISATSATDKLNGYRKVGDILSVSHETTRGVLRTGIWYEWAYTDRYQIPSNPRTWVDTVLPNFHEHFITTSFSPSSNTNTGSPRYLSLTAGVKLARLQHEPQAVRR